MKVTKEDLMKYKINECENNIIKLRNKSRKENIYTFLITMILIVFISILDISNYNELNKRISKIEVEINSTIKTKQDIKVNEICYKGCVYGFTTGEPNVISANGFTRENCKLHCME